VGRCQGRRRQVQRLQALDQGRHLQVAGKRRRLTLAQRIDQVVDRVKRGELLNAAGATLQVLFDVLDLGIAALAEHELLEMERAWAGRSRDHRSSSLRPTTRFTVPEAYTVWLGRV
jgi:hypothetical protein